MRETKQNIINDLKNVLVNAELACDEEMANERPMARKLYQLGYIRAGVKGVIKKYDDESGDVNE